jgi:hypothetical protein
VQSKLCYNVSRENGVGVVVRETHQGEEMDADDFFGFVGLGAIAADAVFLGYPMLNEGTMNSCLALEKHVVGAAANIDDGRAAEQTSRNALPDLPTPLGCSWLYWKSVLGQ